VSNLSALYRLLLPETGMHMERTGTGAYFHHEKYPWPGMWVPECPVTGEALTADLSGICPPGLSVCYLLLPASLSRLPVLREQGWFPVKRWMGMYLDVLPGEMPEGSHFAVRGIKKEELKEWVDMTNLGLYGGKKVLPYPLVERLYRASQVRIFAGFSQGNMVAGVLIFDAGDSRGVYFTSVLPDHRGKGYGRILMHVALHRTDGSEVPVVLHSTEMGEGLYRKCGFVPVEALFIFARRTQ